MKLERGVKSRSYWMDLVEEVLWVLKILVLFTVNEYPACKTGVVYVKEYYIIQDINYIIQNIQVGLIQCRCNF
jgi:hypothetical protein